MSDVDKILAQKEKEKKIRGDLIRRRQQKEINRMEKISEERNLTTAALGNIVELSGEEEDDDDLDSSFELHTLDYKENVLTFPRDIVTPTSSTALRLGLSNRQRMGILASNYKLYKLWRRIILNQFTLSL